jgi:hypothetical protein
MGKQASPNRYHAKIPIADAAPSGRYPERENRSMFYLITPFYYFSFSRYAYRCLSPLPRQGWTGLIGRDRDGAAEQRIEEGRSPRQPWNPKENL